jgi:5-methylcytosine-specific restriction endonuclease McrA
MSYEKQIKELRSQGKNYDEIVAEIGCSKSTVSYHLGEGQKKKTRERTKKLRKENTLIRKVANFKTVKEKTAFIKRVNGRYRQHSKDANFNYKDVIKKFGEKPYCYLTGRVLDITDPKSYHFDHIIPKSKGGKSTLENLGFTCKEANVAKSDLLLEDFLSLCKEILEFQGYKVEKHPAQDSNLEQTG